jgi:integrase
MIVGRPRKDRSDLPQRVYSRRGKLYYSRPSDGSWEPLGPESDLAACYRKLGEVLEARPATAISTVNDLLDAYFMRVVPSKAERTQKDNRNEAAYLRAFFGAMPVTLVKPHHVAEYRDLRTGKVRANREIALLSHAFSKAIEWGTEGLSTNPCSRVSRNKEEPRERYVTDEELAVFRSLCPRWLQLYIDLKNVVGPRKQTLIVLRVSDWTSNGLHIQMQKTRNFAIFEPTPELTELMDKILKLPRYGGEHLFCSRKGLPYTEDGFGSIWKRRMTKFVALGYERFTEHDIRGKFATDYEAEGNNAQPALGHKSRKTTDGYVKAKRVVRVKPLSKTKERL